MHTRRTTGPARLLVRFAAPLAVALAIGVVSPAAALAKGGKTQGSVGPACAVNPSTVAPGSTYGIAASGLPAYTFVNIVVSDSAGTTAYAVQADANGNTSVTGRSYWSGTDSVTVQHYDGHQTTVYATCSFTVT